jgi:hypothetical protein
MSLRLVCILILKILLRELLILNNTGFLNDILLKLLFLQIFLLLSGSQSFNFCHHHNHNDQLLINFIL